MASRLARCIYANVCTIIQPALTCLDRMGSVLAKKQTERPESGGDWA